MNFLHLSMLAGLAAMAVPVALHLLSRRQPKLVTFPALRFVKSTVLQQRSSWQLRHYLLLMLRVSVFGALALAMARPRVHSAMLGTAIGLGILATAAVFATLVSVVAFVTRRSPRVWLPSSIIAMGLWLLLAIWATLALTRGPAVPSSDQTAPVAAALVIDTNPSMNYRTENERRISVAKDMANWILGKLPIDSRVGILTSAPISSLSLDPATAKGQIDILQVQSAHVDLVSRIQTAIELVTASELERKEVYVISDLMSHSWDGNTSSLLAKLNDNQNQVLVQVIDIGAEKPINFQLGDLSSDSQSLPEGADANWELAVSRTTDTPGNKIAVELLQEEINPELPVLRNGKLVTPTSVVVDRKVVDLTNDSTALVSLGAKGLRSGTHNFTIRIDTSDPLDADNLRYATVVAQPQQSALVVADDAEIGRYMRLILNPLESDGSAKSEENALTRQLRYPQLAQVPLDRFKVICLIDPPSLPPTTVALLEQHVAQGGGLLIALGPSLGSPEDATASAMAKLLPGKPVRISRHARDDRSCFLVPDSISHPLFHVFGMVAQEVPWNLYPVFRSWEIENLGTGSQVLMSSTDSQGRRLPAVIWEKRGSGQILTITTPIPSGDEVGKMNWNELTVGSDPWPAFGLLLGSVKVLGGQTQARFNFTAGDTVVLNNDPREYPSMYELFTPIGPSRRVQADNGQLLLGNLDQAGIYRLRGVQSGPLGRSLSVNIRAEDTSLKRLTTSDLDEILGKDKFRIARKREEVESSVGQSRFGRELFPMLLTLVAGLFLAEQAMSNRFYQVRMSASGRSA